MIFYEMRCTSVLNVIKFRHQRKPQVCLSFNKDVLLVNTQERKLRIPNFLCERAPQTDPSKYQKFWPKRGK